mgnify:CR=1 FL=1
MKNLINELSARNISFITDEPMKNHTTFKTGGSASVFISPSGIEELSEILRIIKNHAMKPFILGNGSNLLVSDDGINDRPVIFIDKGKITEVEQCLKLLKELERTSEILKSAKNEI